MKEEIKELCKRVLASNLSDDDKIEIITKLNKENSLTVQSPFGDTIKGDVAYPNKDVHDDWWNKNLGTTGSPCPPLPHVYCKER